MKRPLAIAAVLGCLALPASAGDYNWTWTGPKGGTAAGSGSCSAAGGTATCTRNGTYTSPAGREVTSVTRATRSREGGIRTTTRTGPNGRSATVTVERNR